jgi:membrane fusion protein, macrolide-specific efflux system
MNFTQVGRSCRKHWRTLLGVLVTALAGFMSPFYINNMNAPGSGSTAPMPPAKSTSLSSEVPSALVEQVDITQLVRAVGSLKPKLKVDIGAQVSGQVEVLHVQLGQAVKAGTLLVNLEPDSARNAVQQAEAVLAQQKATVDTVGIDLAWARREAERQHRLLAGGATTAQDAEQADRTLAKLEVQLSGEEARLDQRRADLNESQLKLTYTSVLAPLDGKVVAVAIQQGQTVNAQYSAPTLLTLAQLNTMTVYTRVSEADIGQVQVGQTARFTTLAADTQSYEGKVSVIEPIPERFGSAVYYNVLFDVENSDYQLFSDMTVQVELEVAKASQALTIPIVALGQRDSSGLFTIQVIDAEGSVSSRRVRIGIRNDSRVQILEGLAPGERVLLSPAADFPAAAPH